MIADHLGIEIKAVSQELVDSYMEAYPHSKFPMHPDGVCAWLQKRSNGQQLIWVLPGMFPGRRRLSIFHECGHAVIPWHGNLDYLCSSTDIEAPIYHRIEREAFECGIEFLMPQQMFVKDALSLSMGIHAIKQLSNRYQASMEATAIRYASTHPYPCAVLVVKPTGYLRDPVTVSYSVHSSRFPERIRRGTVVSDVRLIYQAWAQPQVVHPGEVLASTLGSSAKVAYIVDSMALGASGKVLLLLWPPVSIQQGVF